MIVWRKLVDFNFNGLTKNMTTVQIYQHVPKKYKKMQNAKK